MIKKNKRTKKKPEKKNPNNKTIRVKLEFDSGFFGWFKFLHMQVEMYRENFFSLSFHIPSSYHSCPGF